MRYFLLAIAGLLVPLLCGGQVSYKVVKDTTDSNSIVRKVQQMEVLEVRAKLRAANVINGSTGLVVDVKELLKLPNLVGDADPYKALQYMGGVSQAGEASAAMLVRGGNNDQNLVLLNGCKVQNPTHVLGLFSVFNPDLIDQMRFVKSGIPAEYGGRLSSVVDIRNFTASPLQVQMDGSIGFISSRLALKVPLTNRFAFYASQRGSYIGALAVPMLVKIGVSERLAQNDFEFTDTNFGFNYTLSGRTKLSGHFYTGKDRISISENDKFLLDENKSSWGNKVLGVQLNHVFSDKWSMMHAVSATKFYLNAQVNWLSYSYGLQATTKDIAYKTEFVFVHANHKLKSGTELSATETQPAAASVRGDGSENNFAPALNLQNTDVAFFIRDEWEQGNLLLNVGLRAGMHAALDANTIAVKPKIQTGVEPRFFARYLLGVNSSVKLSASRHLQHYSRLALLNFGLPLEVFVPASAMGKSSAVWHYSGGFFKNIDADNIELSAEIYYKSFSNLLEFGGNLSDLFQQQALFDKVNIGKGWAYGTELMLKKNAGKFTGWVSYALGWNYRQFDALNQGKPYLASNDRRHDLSVIAMYALSKSINLSATYVYATGSRLNLPRSWYVMDGKVVLEYNGYNAFSMPSYHRLDVSMNYKLKPLGKLKSELNLAVYNVYNRANPFQVYFSTTSKQNAYDYKIKMSYLLPILPSLSWTFHY